MNKETTRHRQPDSCPNHPESRAYRSRRWQPNQDYALIQHSCADGCDAPLGWEYHGPNGDFQHGPAQCRNPQVINRMRQQQNWANTASKAIAAAILTCTAIILSITIHVAITRQDSWNTSYTVAAVAGAALLAALLYALFRKALKEERKLNEPPAEGTANTPE